MVFRLLKRLWRFLYNLLFGGSDGDTSQDRGTPDSGSDTGQPSAPDNSVDESQSSDTSHDHDEEHSGDAEQSPDTDTSADVDTDVDVDAEASDTAQESDVEADTDVEANPNLSDDVSLNWPPQKRVEAVHEGEGEQEIDISLYWREGDDHGLEACKQVAPYVNYVFENAWGKKYTVGVTVVEEPVPRDVDSMSKFDDYWWNDVDEGTRSKDANCLLIDDDGVNGLGGTRTAVVSGPAYFEGWDYSPDEKPLLFGSGEAHEGVNRVIHEIGHGLGLTHDGDYIEAYGERYVPPMKTSYIRGNRFYHELHKDNRETEPTLNEPL